MHHFTSLSRGKFSALPLLTALLLLIGCEQGPLSSTTTTFRDSTLLIEVYEDRPPLVMIGDDSHPAAPLNVLNEAASQGDVIAHRLLGNAYWQGSNTTLNGVNPFPQNREHALWYYRKGAELGDAPSQYYVGHALEFGKGAEADPAAALGYYEQAARQGHVMAHGQLGYFYVTGTGDVTIDLQRAVEHFRFAAAAGEPNAQFNLGVMYANGDGVEQSLEQAARLYWSAADNGNTGAMVQLAKLLRAGDGVPKDETAALRWLQL
ncbi:MAG: tetratricopeptide repeat protein, partial [Pseudomonadota bacterium]